jgi:hypothetical protein
MFHYKDRENYGAERKVLRAREQKLQTTPRYMASPSFSTLPLVILFTSFIALSNTLDKAFTFGSDENDCAMEVANINN